MQNDELIDYNYLNKIASSFEDSLRCILHKIDEYSYIPTGILNSKELYLLSKSNIDSGQKKFKKKMIKVGILLQRKTLLIILNKQQKNQMSLQ